MLVSAPTCVGVGIYVSVQPVSASMSVSARVSVGIGVGVSVCAVAGVTCKVAGSVGRLTRVCTCKEVDMIRYSQAFICHCHRW